MNHDWLAAILDNMGYAPELVNWTWVFLQDRKVCLSFNNITTKERDQLVGVLQGSPMSPVLLITYTSSLLHKMSSWNNSSFWVCMWMMASFLLVQWSGPFIYKPVEYLLCQSWLCVGI